MFLIVKNYFNVYELSEWHRHDGQPEHIVNHLIICFLPSANSWANRFPLFAHCLVVDIISSVWLPQQYSWMVL